MNLTRTLFLFVLLAALSLAACESQTNTATTNLPPVVADFSVVAEGRLFPQQYVSLNFLGTGPVAEVLVSDGDQVEAGAVLARLADNEPLRAQLAASQLELLNAQKALNDLQTPINYTLLAAQAQRELAVAEDQLDRAERRLRNLAQPDLDFYQDQVDLARDALLNAQASAELVDLQAASEAYYQAQNRYDDILADYNTVTQAIENCDTADPVTNCDPDRVVTVGFIPWTRTRVTEALADAADALRIAELNLTLARRQATDAVDAAEDGLEKAEERLENVQSGPTNLELALAQADLTFWQAAATDATERLSDAQAGPDLATQTLLEQRLAAAEAGVLAAQNSLALRELTAPFAGTIAQINLKVGEYASPARPHIILADFSGWVLETNNLTEIEIVDISVGQGARVVFDALPTTELTATVTKIAEVFDNSRGDVTYKVALSLPTAPPEVRWGMTATITFDR